MAGVPLWDPKQFQYMHLYIDLGPAGNQASPFVNYDILVHSWHGIFYLKAVLLQAKKNSNNSIIHTVYLLETVRLYWPMGSAMAPETAGPMMYPIPTAHETTPIPNAWLLSSDTSEMTAFAVPITPEGMCITRARDRQIANQPIDSQTERWTGRQIIHIYRQTNWLAMHVLTLKHPLLTIH